MRFCLKPVFAGFFVWSRGQILNIEYSSSNKKDRGVANFLLAAADRVSSPHVSKGSMLNMSRVEPLFTRGLRTRSLSLKANSRKIWRPSEMPQAASFYCSNAL